MDVTIHDLPAWVPVVGLTLGHRVYVRETLAGAHRSRVIQHELVHVAQQEQHGLWFWIAYLFCLPLGWNPWRARWEAEAYKVSVSLGGKTAEQAARAMSGPGYLWPCRYARALELLGVKAA